jgi:hypothetical protein
MDERIRGRPSNEHSKNFQPQPGHSWGTKCTPQDAHEVAFAPLLCIVFSHLTFTLMYCSMWRRGALTTWAHVG